MNKKCEETNVPVFERTVCSPWLHSLKNTGKKHSNIYLLVSVLISFFLLHAKDNVKQLFLSFPQNMTSQNSVYPLICVYSVFFFNSSSSEASLSMSDSQCLAAIFLWKLSNTNWQRHIQSFSKAALVNFPH